MSNSASITRQSTFDATQFETLADFDQAHKADVLGEMARLFTSEASRWLSEAEHAAARGDLLRLQRVGHSLKAVCAVIGAERMRTLATWLAESSSTGEAVDYPRLVGSLQQECRAVVTLLRPYLAVKG